MGYEQRAGVDDLLKGDFLVEIDGIAQTHFRTLSGVSKEWSVNTARDGGDPPRHRKQRVMETVEDITLTQGRTTIATELEDWYESGDRKSGSVIQLDHNGNEIFRWNFVESFPKKLDLGDWDGMSEDSSINTLIITCEDFKRAYPSVT